MSTSFATSLISRLADRHLLKHPFYQAWTDGSLSKETIQFYARQYYHHVKAFPRYVSATHSNTEDLEIRQLLLENLIDEERGPDNHPELWLRFAEGLGESRENVKNEEMIPETRALVDTFIRASQSSMEEGLGVLFAYEHQIPEVAKFKIDALVKNYAVKDDRTLSFFEVHRQADIYHTEAIAKIMEGLSPESKAKVEKAAQIAADRLWGFLDGIHSRTCQAA